tara:strand:+ start:2703 stop:6200 length:3498 start_codon:yes stop_codon:yes gene_type:complete
MNINELLEPNAKKAVFTFGRFNPPTKGHARLMDVVKNSSAGADHYVFTGKTNDPKKNPLQYKDKITFLRAMFPHMNIMDDPAIRTPWEALEELGKQYDEVVMVVGSDRKDDFETQMRPYLKDFGIDKFSIVSSGERDADASDVAGVSASKARAFARAGDFKSFSQTIDGGEKLKQQLYTKVRQGMGIMEMANKPKMPKKPEIKSRDPNWRDMEALRKSGAAGSHKDKKALDKRGYKKHKGKSYDINEAESKPIAYVDMDGVIANFFAEYAKLAGVKSGNYRDIPPAKTDPTLNKMIGTDFFNRLPKFPTTDKLIQLVVKEFGSYKILSSPLRGDHENSKQQKIKWIQRELGIQPDEIIVVGRKESYAVQADGTPNILIDDRGRNIEGWRSRGGYGIKYQADEDPLSKVADGIKDFKEKNNLTEGDFIPFPDNTVVVDIDNKNDYYQLTKDMSSLDKADKKKYGKKGKPDTIISFQSKEIKDQTTKDIKKHTGMKTRDTKHSLLYNNPGKSKKSKTKVKVKVKEHGGRVVKGINTTADVGVDAIKKQSAKFGFKVTKDGVPPIMAPKNLRRVKRMQEALIKINGSNKDLTLQQQIDLQEIKKGINKIVKEAKKKRSNPTEVPYQNQGGQMSLLTHPGTELHQKMRATAKPGTDEWFKTWRTLAYLTKGRKNHYMLPIKEQLEELLIKHGIIKESAPAQDVQQSLNNIKQDLTNKNLDPNVSNKIANYLKALANKVAVAYKNITGQQPPQTEDAEQISMASVEQMQQMIAHMCKVDMNKCGQFLIQNKIVASIDQAENYIKNILPQNVKKDVDMIHKAGKDAGAGEVSDWFAGLDDDIMRLASKASGNRVIQREITNRFKGSFTTEVLVKKNITKESLTKFLQDAEDGKVIDMQSLVSNDSGNIGRYVGAEYKSVFDAIKTDVFPYSPPGTGHNMGPGEVALTMFGNPIVKGEVGDLNVGGVLYELKGAKTRNPAGKSAKSGGRMNGKDVSKPTTGRSAIKKWISANLGDEALRPYVSGTKLLELNWNGKGIQNINKLIADNIQDMSERDAKMKDFMLDLWKTMIQNHKAIPNFDARIQSMVTNGQLNDTSVKVVVELLYESYADSDGEKDESGKQKPFNIMVFNAQSLEYKIIRATDGFVNQGIKVIGGIDWNDANASASPQLYID